MWEILNSPSPIVITRLDCICIGVMTFWIYWVITRTEKDDGINPAILGGLLLAPIFHETLNYFLNMILTGYVLSPPPPDYAIRSLLASFLAFLLNFGFFGCIYVCHLYNTTPRKLVGAFFQKRRKREERSHRRKGAEAIWDKYPWTKPK